MDRLALFHSLPYPLKVVAASLYGYRLGRRRYDDSTDALVRAALERDSWTPEQWQSYQAERLGQMLEHSHRAVPYYRGLWQDRSGEPTRLADWPILEKEPLRRDPQAFVDPRQPRRGLLSEHTSGSTGTPLQLVWNAATARHWYALVEARSRLWYGVDRRAPWAILGGQLVTAQSRRRPPFWVWNRPLRQLYCSAYHLSPKLVPHYLAAFESHGIRHLYGYASALDALAQGLEEGDGGGGGLLARAQALELAAVVTNAEPLFEHQRRRISRVFRAPVRETYGMAELVAAASECEEGQLHLWPEVGVLELVDSATGDPVEEGAGELVCTGLLNTAQPLIRYRVGDRARTRPGPCACGRGLPMLASVEGRVDDVIVTPEGRQVGRLDPIFKGDLPMREAQIIQDRPDRLRLRYVPGPGFTEATADTLRARLQDRVGAMHIVLEPCAALPRSRAGKLRAVVNLLDGKPPAAIHDDRTPDAMTPDENGNRNPRAPR